MAFHIDYARKTLLAQQLGWRYILRLVFGAGSSQILRLVMHEGISVLVARVVLGIAGSAIVARFLQPQLFGIGAFDVPTYALAIAVIAAAAVLASSFSARKVSVSNPLKVMRAD